MSKAFARCGGQIRAKLHSIKYTVYYSGNDTPEHCHGMGITVSKHLNKAVKHFVPISDRIAILQMEGKPVNINIIIAYAPTAQKKDAIVEQFYEKIQQTLKLTKTHHVNSKSEKVIARTMLVTGLVERNERGERLIQHCQEKDLTVLNTFLQLPARRLSTWRSPQDNSQNIIENQIHYTLIKKRFWNSVLSVSTYPSAHIGSDHNLLMGVIVLRLK
ncbi:hypothetical protein ILUMI_10734 [Ignelater luminosus]|uniref:Uncharacterized protein n=1 Tax=Ignelater luminosus TaxID=2038154 RepID=A0A8K0G8E5_IGNLU|nr:hypothetical protein ILUMI_10734 [Ignelater luminosus]